MSAGEDPLQPHSHDPNPDPPHEDPTFELIEPGRPPTAITPLLLQVLPTTSVANCYIVSTGHGTSGPFTFTGVKLLDLVEQYVAGDWSNVEVVSADGFGNRVTGDELLRPSPAGPVILAHTIDGTPMTREQGLVRLVVPSERDDALRQVKWVGRITVRR